MSERGRSQEQALIGRLQQAPVFHRLAGRYLQVMRKIARPQPLAAGAVVIEASVADAGLWILIQGRWRVGPPEDGDMLEPIATAGEVALLTGRPAGRSVVSEGDSVALQIPQPILEQLFARDAELHQRLCRNVIGDLSQRLIAANADLEQLGAACADVESDLEAIRRELNDARMLESMRG